MNIYKFNQLESLLNGYNLSDFFLEVDKEPTLKYRFEGYKKQFIAGTPAKNADFLDNLKGELLCAKYDAFILCRIDLPPHLVNILQLEYALSNGYYAIFFRKLASYFDVEADTNYWRLKKEFDTGVYANDAFYKQRVKTMVRKHITK